MSPGKTDSLCCVGEIGNIRNGERHMSAKHTCSSDWLEGWLIEAILQVLVDPCSPIADWSSSRDPNDAAHYAWSIFASDTAVRRDPVSLRRELEQLYLVMRKIHRTTPPVREWGVWHLQ